MRELKAGVIEVGSRDYERKLFDELIPLPLPNGTSYNSYLIFGSDYYTAQIKKPPMAETTFFKDSGYAFIYDHEIGLKVVFDAANIGDKLSSFIIGASTKSSESPVINSEQNKAAPTLPPDTELIPKRSSLKV